MTFSGWSSIRGLGVAGLWCALLLGAAWWQAEAEQEHAAQERQQRERASQERLRQERQRRELAAQERLRQEQAAAERERVGTAHAAAVARAARERQQRAAAASQIHLKKLQLAAHAERRIFHGSAFQQVYDRTPAKPHAELGGKGVHQRLVALGRKRDAKMFSQQTEAGKTIVQAAINLWTAHDRAGQNALFKDLNRVLIDVNDDEDELERWMWFVRLATHWIVRPSNALESALTVWRGSKMTKKQASRLFAGLVVRPPMFVSTTIDRNTADGFRQFGKYLVELAIPAGCRNACSVSEHSDYAGEKEFLLPPYTAVRIDRVDHDSQLVKGTVLDNVVHYMEAEIVTGRHAPAWPL